MTEHRIQGIGITELAERFGTPLYVYDSDALREQFMGLRTQLDPRLELFYSLKANPNLSVCAALQALGARAEVSSLAEMETALRAGVSPENIIFLGPGKSQDELTACLDTNIRAIVCESFQELAMINRLAALRGTQAAVAVRVNPSFSVKGSGLTMGGKPRQFGIDEEQLLATPDLADRHPHLRLMGVHVYLGTRILSETSIRDNTVRIMDLADRLSTKLSLDLDLLDIGGGLGVSYFDGEQDIRPDVLAGLLNPIVADSCQHFPRTRLVMELGRYLTALAGLYVVRVRYTKTSVGERFAIADGGTNHHMAAVGVGSFVKRNFPIRLLNRDAPVAGRWHITGPLCTPNDTIGRGLLLADLRPGDLLGVLRSGAYGLTASPVLFLSHGAPAEVLVERGEAHLVRERDHVNDLLRQQRLIG